MKRWTKLARCKRCDAELPTGRNVYCSDECFRFARNEQRKTRDTQLVIELTCDFCHRPFQRSKYRLNRSRGNFCDRSCASKFYKANGSSDRWTFSARLNAKGDWVSCAGCGEKQVYREPREVVVDVAKCCDRKCQALLLIRVVPSKGQLELHAELVKLHPSLLPPEQTIATPRGTFRVDALFPQHKLVVEYQGDWWHANPATYGPDDRVGSDYGMRAADVWERDTARKKAIEEAGFVVCWIWESDWKRNPQKTLQSIKSELERLG